MQTRWTLKPYSVYQTYFVQLIKLSEYENCRKLQVTLKAKGNFHMLDSRMSYME